MYSVFDYKETNSNWIFESEEKVFLVVGVPGSSPEQSQCYEHRAKLGSELLGLNGYKPTIHQKVELFFIL